MSTEPRERIFVAGTTQKVRAAMKKEILFFTPMHSTSIFSVTGVKTEKGCLKLKNERGAWLIPDQIWYGK